MVRRSPYSFDASKFQVTKHIAYRYLCNLELTTNGFSTTENTDVTIKAIGYEDQSFTVDKNGDLVK